MKKNKEYQVSSLSSDEIIKKLESSSPLQASKVLLDIELADQENSLKILQNIEMEKIGGGESLVKSVMLNVCDGLVSSQSLGLSKFGLTGSRLANEIKNFSYSPSSGMVGDSILEKQSLDENTKTQKDDKGDFSRKDLEDKNKLEKYKDNLFEEKRKIHSELEVNEKGQRRALYKQSDTINENKRHSGKNFSKTSVDIDHQVPLKEVFRNYSESKALSLDDLKNAANEDTNFKAISAELNRSKKDKSWSEYIKKVKETRLELENKKIKNGKLSLNDKQKLENLPRDETLRNALKAEKISKNNIEKTLNKTVVKNLVKDYSLIKESSSGAFNQTTSELQTKGIGELIILIIKPLFFEISDIFKNGVLYGVNSESKLEAIGLRFKRASKYIVENIKNIGIDVLKDALKNFVKHLFNAIVNMFVGILKKALTIICEGFSAIIQSIKILMGKGTPAQKADAITKLLATTVVTYITFAFDVTAGEFLEKIPFLGSLLAEGIKIIISGVGSSIVVWLLDQADIFSTKAEKRTQRVKEVFDMRIKQIKENTDIFEKTALEKLAQDRIGFRKLSEKLSSSIESNKNTNFDIIDIASFMKIDLQVKSQDDFLDLLRKNKTLEIA